MVGVRFPAPVAQWATGRVPITCPRVVVARMLRRAISAGGRTGPRPWIRKGAQQG